LLSETITVLELAQYLWYSALEEKFIKNGFNTMSGNTLKSLWARNKGLILAAGLSVSTVGVAAAPVGIIYTGLADMNLMRTQGTQFTILNAVNVHTMSQADRKAIRQTRKIFIDQLTVNNQVGLIGAKIGIISIVPFVGFLGAGYIHLRQGRKQQSVKPAAPAAPQL
jgi:hypothetical protein